MDNSEILLILGHKYKIKPIFPLWYHRSMLIIATMCNHAASNLEVLSGFLSREGGGFPYSMFRNIPTVWAGPVTGSFPYLGTLLSDHRTHISESFLAECNATGLPSFFQRRLYGRDISLLGLWILCYSWYHPWQHFIACSKYVPLRVFLCANPATNIPSRFAAYRS